MRIGLIAPPWVAVPPPRYGGTEQVVDDLARGLEQRGHEVRLFTIGESTCPVPTAWWFEHPVVPMGATLPEVTHAVAAYHQLTDVDVIHDHTLAGPLVAAATPGLPPVAVTNHNRFCRDARLVFREIALTAAVVAISQAQRATAPDVPVTAVIPHGVDLDRYAFGPGDGDHLMFIGRMSPDKGVDTAIRVAQRAGRPLVIVSKMREPEERAFFDAVVRPALGDHVRMVDEPDRDERIGLLRSAVALLDPIAWPEPFGLVMAESLSCGTPVLAFPNGAAPEIVDHGVTGFLCADEDAMVEGVGRVEAIDRTACRHAAEQRFDHLRMAADHERLYERLVRRTRDDDDGRGTRRRKVPVPVASVPS